MNKEHLKFLIDPKTGSELELEIVEYFEGSTINVKTGYIRSKDCEYVIRNGIPRFVTSQGYSGNFGMQWKRWPKIQYESQNVGSKMEGYTKDMWEKINNCEVSSIKDNKVVLDVGCGSGRFIDLFKDSDNLIIGLDFSNSIEVVAEIFGHRDNYLLIQADALNMPLKDEVVDIVYSIGVLHHTPSPNSGLAEMARVCKSNGNIALAVYGKGSHYDYFLVSALRRSFNKTYPIFGYLFPLLYSYIVVSILYPIHKYLPLIGKVLKKILPFIYIPSFKWSLLDTFDSLTPSFQSTHTSFEVFNWFERSKIKNIKPSNWGFTSYNGKK